MKIQGTARVGEATRWSNRAMAPLTGSPRPMIFSNLIAAVLAILGGGLLAVLTERHVIPAAAMPFGFALVAGVAILAAFRGSLFMLRRNFRRALIERGVPDPASIAVELLPDELYTRTTATEHRVAWSAVSEVLLVGPYWFILAEALPICIPRRWFTSPTEERAFLAALNERLGPESRKRSPQMQKFLSRSVT